MPKKLPRPAKIVRESSFMKDDKLLVFGNVHISILVLANRPIGDWPTRDEQVCRDVDAVLRAGIHKLPEVRHLLLICREPIRLCQCIFVVMHSDGIVAHPRKPSCERTRLRRRQRICASAEIDAVEPLWNAWQPLELEMPAFPHDTPERSRRVALTAEP